MFERKQSGFIPCSDNLTCAFHLRAFSRDQKDPDTCSSLVNKPGGCSTGQGSRVRGQVADPGVSFHFNIVRYLVDLHQNI